MRTLGRPNESDELRRLTQRVFNLERARGEARVARSGDKMTGRLYGPTGLDPISTDEYARKAYVDAQANTRMLVDAKGDLLVGTAPDTLDRLGVGTNHQRLTALSTASHGMVWTDPVETWTGAELPTTDLRPGRMVRATNLDSTKYWMFNNRIYYYDVGTLAWRLLTSDRQNNRLSLNVTVAGDSISTPQMEVDFGFAPCVMGVEVSLQGAAYRSGASDARAKVALMEGLTIAPSPIDVRHIHILCTALADSAGRPTGSCRYFSGRNLGADNQRIAYHVRFEAIGTGGVVFAGDSKCFWELVVTVS